MTQQAGRSACAGASTARWAHLLNKAAQAQVTAGRELRVTRVEWLQRAVRRADAPPGVPLLDGLHVYELGQLGLEKLAGPHQPICLARQPCPCLHCGRSSITTRGAKLPVVNQASCPRRIACSDH